MPLKRTDSSSSGGQSGELALLRHIRTRAGKASGAALRLGIGDDCALLRPRPGEELAVTTDLSIAGRHFRLDWHSPESIGHRALARGLSDLAAMGARPIAAFLSLGLPRELTIRAGHRRAWVDSFLDGLLALAAAHKTPLAGGDLSESPIAVADIVLVGAVPQGKALLRSTARPGHLLYVTGALGGAAAAVARLAELAELVAEKDRIPSMRHEKHTSGAKAQADSVGFMRGLKPPPPSRSSFSAACKVGVDFAASTARLKSCPDTNQRFSAACEAQPARTHPPRIPKELEALLAPHLYPQPRITQGLWLVRHGLASAAIDVSDGLSTDLAHLCQESGVAAEVDAALLPIHPAATLAQALNGGEDYELLFTAPPTARLPRSIAGVAITQIGRIAKRRPGQPTITLITPQGPQPLEPQGWEHFS
jgi:thiamine monophosphate kinase